MSINFKKILLAGTALVAVAAFSVPALATDTLTGAATWGNNANGLPALGTGNGDNVSLATHNLLITNDQTSNDGEGLNTFTVGTVDNNLAGADALNVTQAAAGTAAALTVTIGAYTNSGTGATTMTIQNNNTAAQAVNVTDSGVLTMGGALAVTNNATTATKAVNLTVTGIATVTGATGLTAGTLAGADANLTLNAASNTLTGLVTLTEAAGGGLGGKSTLTFGAANTTDTVTNGINAAAGNEGTVVLAGSNVITSGAAFGTVNSLFAVNVTGVGTTSSISSATKATTVNVTGAGSTFTNTGAVTATTLNINGLASTVNLNAGGANTITTTNFGADGTVVIGTNAGTISGAVTTTTTNTGTLTLAAGTNTVGGLVGTSTNLLKTVNAGAIGGTSNFTALVDATALNVTGTGAVNLNAAAGTNLIGTTNFAGGAGAVVTVAGGGNLTGNVTTSTTNTGTLTLAGASTVTGTLGTATTGLLANVNAGTGADVITGNVYSTLVTMTGNAGVAFGGNVTGTTLVLGATTGTETFASGMNLTAAVTGSAASTLSFLGGAQTSTGVINDNAAIINAGATGATTTFASAVTAATINVTGNGSVALNGATAANLVFGALSTGTVTVADTMNFTGAIGGTGGVAGAGIGNVILSGTTGGITTIGAGSTVLKSLTLAGGSSTVQKTDTVGVGAAAVLAADTTTLNGNALADGGTFALGAGQTLNATIYGTGLTGYGHVTTAAAATLTPTSVINLTNASAAYIPSATAFNILNGAASTNNLGVGMLYVNGVQSTGLAGAQVVTAGLMTYTETPGANDLVVTVTHANPGTVALTGNGASVGTVLNQTNTTTGVDAATFAAVQGNLQNAASAAAVTSILSSVAPTVDGSSTVTALGVGAQAQAIDDARIASIRGGDALSGVAAGASANGWNMWLQGFGQHGQQDMKDLIAGYKADTWGGAVGVDSSNMISNGVLGVSFNYGYTTSDSANANTTRTDVDNYGFNLYGGYDLGQQYFLNGQLGYAYNKITDDRHNVGGVAGLTAHGDTNSDQYMAKVAVGRDFAQDRGLTLTPSVSAAYTHLHTKGFTETGAGGLDNVVGSSDLNDLKLGVGVNAGWNYKNTDGSTLKPAVHVGYAYDALNDRVDVSSTFVGDSTGTAFTTEGASPDRSSFNAGAGIVYATTANWDLSANYDYTYRTNYDSHTGVVRATSHF